MIDPFQDYDQAYADFRWNVPRHLNMATQVCDLWCERDPDKTAIIDATDLGNIKHYTYADLSRAADTLAHHLKGLGVSSGDRIGVLRSQDLWTAAAHIAIWKLGAISIPLFKLFGPEALSSRILDAGAKCVIVDEEGHSGLSALNVTQVLPEELTLSDQPFACVNTSAETPAVLIYTSGTTGKSKGALHVIWTPADWAWIGGLFDVLMPGLALGVPVVAARLAKFTPDAAKEIIETLGVKNVFFPPTALRMIKAADCNIAGLRSVASGGEPLGAEMLEWARDALGVTINEFYGQTECNMVVSSCQAAFPVKNGAIGKPVPGFDVNVIDDAGSPTEAEGDIAIRRGAVSMMIEYWNNPAATQEKFRGDWMLTGDRGIVDQRYIRFVGRDDDVITSAGYRIGPAEIEDCLLTHPAVATVGVVGKPDPMRTEIVKAYVVLKPEFTASDELRDALKMYVKERLAKHAYPRARAENEGAEQ
ncbi:MAG: AMP-dependent synthetase [Rhodobacteraceae bacterium]|nr:AMP-dependent synthetase [Paracoccaceae bacterium]